MVKPPLRTKSIAFKVSEEESARRETAAQASGRTLGEWCRGAILRGGSASDAAGHDRRWPDCRSLFAAGKCWGRWRRVRR